MNLFQAITTGNYDTVRQMRIERIEKEETRKCKTCGEVKDKVKDFFTTGDRHYSMLDCKECYNKRRKENYHRKPKKNCHRIGLDDLMFCSYEQFIRVYFK